MKDNKIPERVSNLEAWNDYLEMQEALNNCKERIYKTSIEDLFIDFLTPSSIIAKMVIDLPQSEKDFIENQAHKFSVLKGLVLAKKRESYITVESAKDFDDVLKLRQIEILEYFGRFFKVSEVLKIINVDWGYSITRAKLETFVKANQEKIIELQDTFKKDYSDIRLGYKRSRLDELSYIYKVIKSKFEEHELREDAKTLQSLLESIKKECDGDLVVNIHGKIDIEHNITFQVQNELMKDFNITALIINKMSGRLGVNPNFIQSRLMNSHYAKFTGFKGLKAGEDRLTDEIYSPSGITYNLDDIENKNIEITREEDKLKNLPIIEQVEEVQILSFRDKLKAKLAEEQQQLNKLKNNK